MEKYLEQLIQLLIEYSPKVITALILLIVGLFVIKILIGTTRKITTKRNLEITLQKFLLNLLSWALKILLFVMVVSKLGIETTSFAAILAAAGLAVGLALQGSLSNFAGGVLIMIFRPFKIGDVIEAQGEIGSVKEIEIFTTKLIGLSNKEIIIPNGSLSNGNIVNYSATGTRRVDLTFGVSYEADIKKIKEVLQQVLDDNPSILKDPAPTIAVSELADSSVNFVVRPWCNTTDYWNVYFDVTEKTKIALDEAGIEIPYPHHVQINK